MCAVGVLQALFLFHIFPIVGFICLLSFSALHAWRPVSTGGKSVDLT